MSIISSGLLIIDNNSLATNYYIVVTHNILSSFHNFSATNFILDGYFNQVCWMYWIYIDDIAFLLVHSVVCPGRIFEISGSYSPYQFSSGQCSLIPSHTQHLSPCKLSKFCNECAHFVLYECYMRPLKHALWSQCSACKCICIFLLSRRSGNKFWKHSKIDRIALQKS